MDERLNLTIDPEWTQEEPTPELRWRSAVLQQKWVCRRGTHANTMKMWTEWRDVPVASNLED